ncbi:hypothetical protein DAPPUDRAFT_313414 [Daphnia pulex]|uniref:Uncharacterized protein n=1 Tax=Daphnia pulex TaxID=6669 RepID=E9G467_DAPPU|nr:hypothetical protein DAPPUDRAFT_313414 [Daphnia pulex]|eukprot:EFX85702.1 hypothetical protein DAPPUDRAFT_313414 [Daphnia pulex]
MELGADSAKLSSQGFPLLIYFFRAIPFIMFPITMNFSGAILCYWLTTNVISLVQVGFLRLPKVRSYFDIDPIVVVQPVKGAGPKKGFVEGMKEAWNNQKITAELNDRQRLIDSNFRRADIQGSLEDGMRDWSMLGLHGDLASLGIETADN